VAVTQKLLEQGRIPRDESIVISITGNGLKTLEAVLDKVEKPCVIKANIEEFNALMEKKEICTA
jgi:threonine synthase